MTFGTGKTLIKNVSALSLGQLASRGLMIVYLAILARYIKPDGMGQLGTAQSLTALVFLFVNLGFDTLAVRDIAQDRQNGSVYLSSILFIKGILAGLAMVVLILISGLAKYGSDTTQIIFVYGLVSLVGGLVSIGNSILQANERLEIVAAIQLGRDIANVSLSLLVIALGGNLLQIVEASLIANILHVVIIYIFITRLKMAKILRPNWAQSRTIIQKGLPFGMVALLNTLYNQTGPVLLSILATKAITGAFWSASSLLAILFILPSMYSQAVLPVFSRFYSEQSGQLQFSYQKSFKLLTSFGVPLAAGTILLAKPLVELLFGPGYQESIIALQILVITLALSANFASGPVLNAMGKQKLYSILLATALVIMVVLYVLLIPTLGIIGASLAYTIPVVIGFVIYSIICHRLLQITFPAGMILRILGATLVMSGIVFLGREAGIHFLILGCFIGPITYAVSLFVLGGVDEEEKFFFRTIFKFQKQPG